MNEEKRTLIIKIIRWLVILFLVYIFLRSGFYKYILPPTHGLDPENTAIKSIIYSDVIQYNIAYLTLAIGFVFLLGGAFYFLNIKPIEKKITDQEIKHRELEDRIGQKISEQNLAAKEKFDNVDKIVTKIELIESKVIATEARIQSSEEKSEIMQLDMIWNQHYTWQNSNLHANDIIALVFYLQLIVQFFKKTSVMRDKVEMCLRQIIFLLNIDNGTLPTSILKQAPTGMTPRNMMDQHFSTLMGLFPQIQIPELEILKTEIKEKIITNWYGGAVPNQPTPATATLLPQ